MSTVTATSKLALTIKPQAAAFGERRKPPKAARSLPRVVVLCQSRHVGIWSRVIPRQFRVRARLSKGASRRAQAMVSL